MTHLVHIINPVKVDKNSDLYNAQPITFESMSVARNFSKHKEKITICTTQFEEDKSCIPENFKKLSNLDRSVLDVNTELKTRKLPLIKDVLYKIKEIDSCDYCIYTNVDIALMPHFYDTVFEYLEQGHDAVVINRRRLSNNYNKIEQLPLMYADMGKSHPGFDCFVFKTSLLDSFIMDSVCIGISFLEATLVHNIFSFAEKPLYVPYGHLTFHIGMDVLVPRKNNFYKHNRRVFFKTIYPQLKPYFSLKKFPYGTLNFPNRMVKWGLNPSLFTLNYLSLEKKNLLQIIKIYLDEIRWRILQR